MSTEPPNPPAFPLMGIGPEDGKPVEFHGMTLRDYFAAKVMQSILAGPGALMVAARDGPEIVAANSYEMADAMLAERQKPISA